MKTFLDLTGLEHERLLAGKSYLEFLRVEAMSAGVYVLEAGAEDLQSPHQQDEIYYVISGTAHMQVGEEDEAVSPGTVIFVPAKVKHHFHDISEKLTLLVFFAPAES
jgi:mannose-6-phosphate isomerase-like protein (cupin superfamily)